MTTPPNQSVIKAFKILMAFEGTSDAGLKLNDVSRIVKLPIPTAHRFLRTLVSVGALEVNKDGNYRLGSAIKQLRTSALSNFDLDAILTYHAQQLTFIINETVHIAMLRGEMARYVVKSESSRSLRLASKVGSEFEPYCTGVGKVLLAHTDRDVVNKYINKEGFIALTERTIVEPAELLNELEKVRNQGFALDDEEFEDGLRCAAVPLFIGSQIFALSVSGPVSRIKTNDIPKVVKELRRRARLIEIETKGIIGNSDTEQLAS